MIAEEPDLNLGVGSSSNVKQNKQNNNILARFEVNADSLIFHPFKPLISSLNSVEGEVPRH